jgi:triosephosphate isomerase (TIM)
MQAKGNRMSARTVIAGNWKMNGVRASLDEASTIQTRAQSALEQGIEVVICPPATLLHAMVQHVSRQEAAHRIGLGGQDCHFSAAGAHTGDISAAMLVDAGARYVILGHSERRADHQETSKTIAAKVKAAVEAGLIPIVCVGETETERDAGDAYKVVLEQLEHSVPAAMMMASLIVAYEPVWAIGTGRVPGLDDIAQMHASIRKALVERFGDAAADVPILYGGSVKPGNARDILSVTHVNGALVGGASLKATDFLPIIEAAEGILRSS